MQIVRDEKSLTLAMRRLKARGRVGFVPTMGALHEGHISLMKHARKENRSVVVSIFVNPTQFGPKEDFKRYPRTLSRDVQLLKRAKVDLLIYPTVEVIYPKRKISYVVPGPLAKPLCGRFRPGHFRGVVTVVHRLFNLARPDQAYFGEKDFQQLLLIKAMAKRLHPRIKVKACPIVREPDGLAMSSRNRYLSKKDRQRALALSQSLRLVKKLITSGICEGRVLEREMKALLEPRVDRIDYAEVVDPQTLKPVRRIKGKVLVVLACWIGKTRLIDNMVISV